MTLTRKWWVLIWLLSWKSPSDGKLCSTFVQPTQKIPIMCHVMLSQHFHPTKNYEVLKKDATLFKIISSTVCWLIQTPRYCVASCFRQPGTFCHLVAIFILKYECFWVWIVQRFIKLESSIQCLVHLFWARLVSINLILRIRYSYFFFTD